MREFWFNYLRGMGLAGLVGFVLAVTAEFCSGVTPATQFVIPWSLLFIVVGFGGEFTLRRSGV